MKLLWDEAAWTDYVAWQTEDAKIAARINLLLRECLRTPLTGTGKPEPLKRDLKGWWSRRITSEHRLAYRVEGAADAQSLGVVKCRFLY